MLHFQYLKMTFIFLSACENKKNGVFLGFEHFESGPFRRETFEEKAHDKF